MIVLFAIELPDNTAWATRRHANIAKRIELVDLEAIEKLSTEGPTEAWQYSDKIFRELKKILSGAYTNNLEDLEKIYGARFVEDDPRVFLGPSEEENL